MAEVLFVKSRKQRRKFFKKTRTPKDKSTLFDERILQFLEKYRLSKETALLHIDEFTPYLETSPFSLNAKIENREPSIHLCLHYRHFRPGEPITENIRHAVQESKMTVVILSRNFLESEWCLLEFKTALIQTFQDKVHRVIVVKIGELPKEIDPIIKIYLDSTTYLTWEDSNFWNKLLYILPSRSILKSPVLRFVGDNESVFHFSSF